MHRTSLLLASILIPAATSHAIDHSMRTDDFDTALVRLLQPDSVFSERSDARALSETIKSIEAALSAYAASRFDSGSIDGCTVYVAIRSGGRLKTWTQSEGKDRREIDAFIGNQIDKTAVAPISKGALVFSIHGIDSDPSNLAVVLTPSEWQKAAKDAGIKAGTGLEMEHLIDLVWPGDHDA